MADNDSVTLKAADLNDLLKGVRALWDVGILIGTIVALFSWTLTRWCFWGWFVVPMGAPTLTYWHVFILGWFVTATVVRTLPVKEREALIPDQDDRRKADATTLFTSLMASWIMLGVGAIFHFAGVGVVTP